MRMAIKGFIVGLIMVLPGLSAGTIFVILGMFEDMITDIKNLNLKPYFTLGLGLLVGTIIGGYGFALLFQTHRDVIAAFLLGSLIASTRALLRDCPDINLKRVLFLITGILIGYFSAGDPVEIGMLNPSISYVELFLGGGISSALMILPGVPGSLVLIAMGMYDQIFSYFRDFAILRLLVFATGGLGGILLLSNILAKLYVRHKPYISYFFTGVILGSARAVVPYTFGIPILALGLLGFFVVWIWGGQSLGKA
jgi:putative membrane protein